MTKVRRVEKHIIKRKSAYYELIDSFCLKSKNLYNHANYIVREEFVKNNRWVRYGELDKILKEDKEYPDYREMPTSQSAQQVLRLLDKNWTSFFKSIKEWGKNKEKYLGRPKLPKYKEKTGRYELILTNQNVKLKEGKISFPKVFNGYSITPKCINRENYVEINQVRFLSRGKEIVVEIVYSIEIENIQEDNKRYASIDVGVNNLATLTTNIGTKPIVINGKGIKSYNKYYNKEISHYRGIAKRMNGRDYTKRMEDLTRKRNNRINDYMHKASRYIVDYCEEKEIGTIVIGHNKEWKQGSKLSKVTNQSFIQIPMQRLIELVTYKAEEKGIRVIETEESYTSGTSFLDGEMPIKENYNKSRRKKRGLFVSNKGIGINADVNGSYQILKKVFPEAYVKGIEGVALHPIVVNVA